MRSRVYVHVCCRFKWRLWGTNVQDDVKWSEMYNALLKYGKNKDGNYNARKTFKITIFLSEGCGGGVDGEGLSTGQGQGAGQVMMLGQWLHTQRERKLKGKLRPDREAMLQVIKEHYFDVSGGELESSACSVLDNKRIGGGIIAVTTVLVNFLLMVRCDVK